MTGFSSAQGLSGIVWISINPSEDVPTVSSFELGEMILMLEAD